jgi:hypothetical protein
MSEFERVVQTYRKVFKRDIPGGRRWEEELIAKLREAIESGVPYPEDDPDVVY